MDASSAAPLAAEFAMHAASAPARARGVVQHYGVVLLLQVMKYSSGYEGGPEVETGRYLASHRVEFGTEGGGYSAEVGTDEDRGFALEFGYVATDSEGESTIHHPYPHYRPALAATEEPFVLAMTGLVIV
jgi:hypothetical protein